MNTKEHGQITTPDDQDGVVGYFSWGNSASIVVNKPTCPPWPPAPPRPAPLPRPSVVR
jgi:hypothetical protein